MIPVFILLLLILVCPSPMPGFCPETVIPAYEASSPWTVTVMVGETFGPRRRFWVLRGCGVPK